MRRFVQAAGLGAVVVWSTAAGAAGIPADQASKDQWKAAQKTFQVADELYDARRFEEALTAYRASYDIVASPNSRLMVARSLRELGRLEEAYYELEGTVADAESAAEKDEKYAPTARAAREELEALRQRVALIRIELVRPPPGTRLSVGGRRVEPEALKRPLVVAPGPLTIVAEAPGRPKLRRELTLDAGTSSALELDLKPGAPPARVEPAPRREPAEPVRRAPSAHTGDSGSALRPWAWVAGGVGLVGLASFGVFGALNNSTFGDLESDCPDGHCSPDRGEDIDTGRTYQTLANVGLAVGVIGLGTGAALFFASSDGKGETSGASRRAWVGVGAGSVRVGGRF